MAITKQKKKEITDKVIEAIKGANTVTFLNFKSLPVSDTTAMRKELKSKGVSYFVAKKTLLRRALEALGFEGEIPDLSGEVAVAHAKDLLSSPREIFTFEKKFKDSIKILGGVFERKYIDRDKALSLAAIPDRPILYGQFVNLINSPIQGLVIALNEIAERKS